MKSSEADSYVKMWEFHILMQLSAPDLIELCCLENFKTYILCAMGNQANTHAKTGNVIKIYK